MDLTDKVALITGASGGIGKSIAKTLASHNCNLILHYNSNDKSIGELETELNKYNIKVLIIKADISKEEDIILLVNKSIEKFKHIDFLINNAGIAIDTLFEDKTVGNFKRILDVNLIGPFLISKYLYKYMDNGRIINITSTNGIDTYYPESTDYDASKAGLISLTHNLAKQLSPNILVNAIACGWVNTDMNKYLDEEFIDKENEKILLHRFAEPDEIANVVLFLVSDLATYINNTIIRVDGGKNV